MKIFIIGPGGVGKTTSGKLLASFLGYDSIDLDAEFCERIENIGTYIANYGYEKYCFENSRLFYNILGEYKDDFVYSLSSGFLVHEGIDELTAKHQKTLKDEGVSILLLPSESIEESTEIVVERQLRRGFGLKEDRERKKFGQRYLRYKEFGDIKIFSYESPIKIAEKMKNAVSSV